MYVSEFQLDSYCGGPPLRFLDLGNGLNVALTYSDQGARQLLEVVPATLFGNGQFFSEPGADVLRTGLGTSLMLRTEDGALRISRRWDAPDVPPVVTTSDQQTISPHQWDGVLARIQPSEYADVFTFHVEHLQRILRSRRQTIRAVERLARQLAHASVMARHRLPTSAARQPDRSGIDVSPLRVGLEKLASLAEQAGRREATAASTEPRRPPTTDDELSAAEHEFRQLWDQFAEGELEWKKYVAAQTWLPLRDRLRDLERQQAVQERQPKPAEVSSTTPQAMERLDERVATLREELQTLRLERQELQRHLKELDQHQAVDQLIPQVEALMLQQKPLAREEDAQEQLRNQLEDLESRAELERSQPGLLDDQVSGGTAVDAVTQARFDNLSDRLREAERERELAEQQLGRVEAAAMTAPPATTAERPVDSVAIHEAQQRIQQLQEQIGWHDDLQEIQRKRGELQHQVRQLYAGQLLPISTVLLFGVPFSVGIGLIIHAVFTAQNGLNWNQVLWGFVLTLVSVVIKIIRDRERGELLAAARRKLARLDERLQRAGNEAAPEDSALVAQLRAAEQELEELERQGPATMSRHPAPGSGQSVEAARRRAQQATQKCRELNQQWRELLIDLDLSPSLTPAHAREALAERAMRSRNEPRPVTTTAEVQIPFLRKELERRQDWLQQQITAFQHLAKELGRPVYGNSISDIAEIFHDVVREARERRQQRAQWQRGMQRLRQKEKTVRENGKRLADQRRQLRIEWQRKQKQQQARQQRDQARQQQLEQEMDHLRQEMELLAERHQLDPQLPPCTWETTELSARISEQQQRVESLRDRLLSQAERRGTLRARLEEPEVSADAPVTAPSESWQALQRQARDLKQQLQDLESQLQVPADRDTMAPQTESEYMVKASALLRRLSGGYFRQMSWQGRHPRLRFRDRRGRRMGTDEVKPAHFANVYFALWLTRLGQYADQGIRFPVVLDDPLRVTAENRTTRVAKMLREFAAMGHQMLLVTRDLRHARVFGQLGVPIADLSDRELAAAMREPPGPSAHHETAGHGIR